MSRRARNNIAFIMSYIYNLYIYNICGERLIQEAKVSCCIYGTNVPRLLVYLCQKTAATVTLNSILLNYPQKIDHFLVFPNSEKSDFLLTDGSISVSVLYNACKATANPLLNKKTIRQENKVNGIETISVAWIQMQFNLAVFIFFQFNQMKMKRKILLLCPNTYALEFEKSRSETQP